MPTIPLAPAMRGCDENPPAFAASRALFEATLNGLEEAAGMSHGELEEWLDARGRELQRQMYQDSLDLRALREARLETVVGADGMPRGSVETGHHRGLHTVFGAVAVTRLSYRRRGCANLYPADAVLNLPDELYSHGLRRLTAIESTRGSFDDARTAIERATGQKLGKRQLEALVRRAAADFDGFYSERRRPPAATDEDLLVLSCDGKGVVMRPDALRKATAEAAAMAVPKLTSRLSKGEKRNRKRVAEVGSVYDAAPAPRTTADIMPGSDERDPAPGPTARNKWLVASVVEDAASVVKRIFDEADRRDLRHQRTWVALVDGNNHQIDRIHAEAQARQLRVPIVVDFIHVLEYVWKAAWCFFAEADPEAERWVRKQALAILDGHAGRVAAGIRRKAARECLDRASRTAAERSADYLISKRPYLDYPTALKRGWPIATGVIEGACRHLVKDRMDITGARWGLDGAEAVLKLRALISNRDFGEYWLYHLDQERLRVHHARYADGNLPKAA
jgi:hypothetical protein